MIFFRLRATTHDANPDLSPMGLDGSPRESIVKERDAHRVESCAAPFPAKHLREDVSVPPLLCLNIY